MRSLGRRGTGCFAASLSFFGGGGNEVGSEEGLASVMDAFNVWLPVAETGGC